MAEEIDFMDSLEVDAGSASTGGGGRLFCKTIVQVGYRTFISNTTNDQTFMPIPNFRFDLTGNKDPRYAAQAAATKSAYEAAKAKIATDFPGAKSTPSLAIQFVAGPTDVFGKPSTWQAVQVKSYNGWGTKGTAPEAKDEKGKAKIERDAFIRPALLKAGIVTPGEYFIEFSYLRNPFYTQAEHEKNLQLLWIPEKTYPTAEAIRAAAEAFYAGSGVTTSLDISAVVQKIGLPGVQGYDQTVMAGIFADLLKDVKTLDVAAVGKKYGLPIPWLLSLKGLADAG